MVVDFGEGVKNVKIMVLTNNMTDLTFQTDPIFKGMVVQPEKLVVSALAEHGFALDIDLDGQHFLFDFGGMGFAIIKNFEVLRINPQKFQKAVLSHGHFDHFGSLIKVLPMLGTGKELIVSPEVFKQKIAYIGGPGETITLETLTENYRALKKEGKVQELPELKKLLLEKLTSENQERLTETKTPVQLAPGVWTSEEIELFDESELTSNLFIKADKTTFERETFRDEIALYIAVKGKGLVVLTGCGHTGIMNIIRHGQKISGIEKIYAVIGGFHLSGSTEAQLNKVIAFFRQIQPEIICGMHCTGFKFYSKLLSALPSHATLGVVGTTFNL